MSQRLILILFPPSKLRRLSSLNLRVRQKWWRGQVELDPIPKWSSREEQLSRALKLILSSFKVMHSFCPLNMTKLLIATQDALDILMRATISSCVLFTATELSAKSSLKSTSVLSKMHLSPCLTTQTTWSRSTGMELLLTTPTVWELPARISTTVCPSNSPPR